MSALRRRRSLHRLPVVLGLAFVGLGWAASARAAPFVYATNVSNNSVSQYDAAGGALTPLTPANVSAGSNQPLGIAVSPDGRNVYVGTSNLSPAGMIFQFKVGSNGSLTLKSSTPPGELFPESLAVSPNGQSVYVVNRFGSQDLFQYTVQTDGSLAPKSPATVPSTGVGPEDVTVSPDSGSVYVTNDNGTVSQYTAAADGTLSPKSPSTVPTGSGDSNAEPFGVAVNQAGDSVYVANFEAPVNLNGSVSQFSVGAGGILSPKSPPSVAAAGHPVDLVVSPDGRNVYATNPNPPSSTLGAVLQYTAGAGGTLTPKSPPAIVAGLAPFGIAITGDGKSVYAADEGSNAISQYSVGTDAGLTPRSPATVAAGGSPYQIVVTPMGVPTNKTRCKNGGWQNFPQFKNQGDCVSFVETGK